MASSAKDAWRIYLESVDEEAPQEAILKETEEFLWTHAGLKSAKAADGVKIEALEKLTDYPESIAVQAFLVRVIRNIEHVSKAGQAAKAASLGSSAGGAPTASSARDMASFLAPTKTANTAKLLADVGLSKLPFVQQLDQGLIDKMAQETTEAKTQGRTPFYYVDLTTREVLPIWLHPEAVGGKFNHDEAAALNGNDPVDSLARLGQALRSATESQRFFRAFAQWSSAWWRYVPIAMSVEQITLVAAIQHADVISQLAEAERAEGGPGFLAFFYDDLVRRQLAARAAKQDPSLDVEIALAKVDTQLLEVAKQRLDSALRAAGLGFAKTSTPATSATHMMAQAKEAAGSLRSSQTRSIGAADTMSRKGGGKGEKNKRPTEPDEPPSRRKLKKANWWQNKKDGWRENKKSKGW